LAPTLPEIRERICDGLAYLGISLDLRLTGGSQDRLGSGAAVSVQACSRMRMMIARHVCA
jgi:hypothetical protein